MNLDEFDKENLGVQPTAEIVMPGQGPQFPQRETELDDEIEQILARRMDTFSAVELRNQICAAIAARGFDVYARPVHDRGAE